VYNLLVYEANKSLGQNFLTDPQLVYAMVNHLDLSETDIVVEIGPGLGILTTELSERLPDDKGDIYAVEIDERFVEKLTSMFLDDTNVRIVKSDILEWLPLFNPNAPFKLIGSLPYYITSPIIHGILEMQRLPEICVLLIQEEVAQKIASKLGDMSYMATIVQTFYNVELLDFVPKTKFDPVPQVDGRMVRFTKRTSIGIIKDELQKYEGFLHKGFASPRKMLNKVFSQQELVDYGINGSDRPEDVAVDKWVEMFKLQNQSNS
jgi:16S rRNA (adenine1518-N6/adenine1519-N6)-dimethyltransferase